MKDLIKYSIRIIIPLIAIFTILKLISNPENKKELKVVNEKAFLFCIEDNIPNIEDSNNLLEDENISNEELLSLSKFIIADEVNLINSIEIQNNTESEMLIAENNNEDSELYNKHIFQEVEQAKTDVTTEIIENSINPKSTNDYQGVKINNSTDYTLTEDMLNPEETTVNKENVLIYHTHTCESYTPTENFQYDSTGNFRTTDLNFSVARVGDELTSQLISYGMNVMHDKTYHDYPSYNGSYSRSLVTAQNILDSNPNTDIVIDLHRDAIADSTYAPKVKIGDEYASQLMFVIGSDKANENHAGWDNNLKFAIKVQKKANELYPGLFKPIILRNSEYNQHIAKAACIIEVGSTGNTLEESIASMKYLAKVLNEI